MSPGSSRRGDLLRLRAPLLSCLFVVALLAGCNGEEAPTRESAAAPEHAALPVDAIPIGGTLPLRITNEFDCLRSADARAPSRCEAAAVCVERSIARLDEIEARIQPEDVRNLALVNAYKARAYSFEEETLYQSIVHHRKAWEIARDAGLPEASRYLLDLGVAQMRLGETKNCILDHNKDSCLFPLSENAQHRDKEGSTAALASFMEFLEREPGDDRVRWLVNVVHQTLGTYPDEVPAELLLGPELYETKIDFPRFVDVGGPVGIQGRKQESGAAVAGDFNGDGLLDLVVSSRGFCDPTLYFENDGNGGFEDKSEASGLASQLNAGHIIQADYDNDGDLDLYLTRGAWDVDWYSDTLGNAYNTLMQNQGDGTFVDVTREVGLRTRRNRNVASVWGDVDNDGDLDLFVCNEMKEPELFRNDAGQFTDVYAESGIQGNTRAHCKGAAFGDIDDDGDLDLYMSYWKADNQLYAGNGDGTFTKLDMPVVEKAPVLAFPTWFFDYDNDGDEDLFVGAFAGGSDVFSRDLQGKPHSGEPQRLFRNRGDGTFEDVTQETALGRSYITMGANYGDLDNDGFEDIYLATGSSFLGDIMPNAMLKNEGGERFVDVTTAGGFGNLQKGHGISFADFDNDGDQDVLAQYGGAFPSDKFFPSLYENPGNANHWLTLRLEGTQANRSAIGSRVHASYTTPAGEVREFHRTVGSGGSFGSNSLQVELGLGEATRLDTLEIRWAGSGNVQRFRNVAADQVLRIVEGNDDYTVLEPAPIRLAGHSQTEPGGGHHH